MKLTIDQIKQIISDAPEGATHVSVTPKGMANKFLIFDLVTGFWSESGNDVFQDDDEAAHIDNFYSIHALSDLRTILEQHERIDTFTETLENLDHQNKSLLKTSARYKREIKEKGFKNAKLTRELEQIKATYSIDSISDLETLRESVNKLSAERSKHLRKIKRLEGKQ